MNYRIDNAYVMIKTDLNNEVGFYIPSSTVESVEIAKGDEIDAADKNLSKIFVFIDGDFKSIFQLFEIAEEKMSTARKESDIESRNWEDHVNSFRNAGM